MDGRYLIDDYVKAFAVAPSEALRAAIERVSLAAIDRMAPFRNGLVFWYDGDVAPRRAAGRRTYSGLTQAYYARGFARAEAVLGRPELGDAADRCFSAILVSSNEGGVLYERADGVAVAQVPSDPRDLVLNGWLSSLVAIDEYAALRRRSDARALVERSATYLASMLHLFDAERFRTSRYSLSGVVRVELRFRPGNAQLEAAEVVVPSEGTYPLLLGDRGHWESRIWPSHAVGNRYPLRPKDGAIRADLVLSRAGAPATPRLKITVLAAEPTEVALYAHLGRYDPQRAVAADRSWVELEHRLTPRGSERLSFELPWDQLDLVAAPTNFGKRIGDRLVNSYHPIHVRRLAQLGERTGIRELADWSRRWAGYMTEWAAMPMYRDRAVLLDGATVSVASLAGRSQ
jgi:hypothetical protein